MAWELLTRREKELCSDEEWNSVLDLMSHLPDIQAAGGEPTKMIQIFTQATQAYANLKKFDAHLVQTILGAVGCHLQSSAIGMTAYALSGVDKFTGAD